MMEKIIQIMPAPPGMKAVFIEEGEEYTYPVDFLGLFEDENGTVVKPCSMLALEPNTYEGVTEYGNFVRLERGGE